MDTCGIAPTTRKPPARLSRSARPGSWAADMSAAAKEYVRLRQVCLVAPALEPSVGGIATVVGLAVCYRDPNVCVYGLENALLPVGTTLLEMVSPIEANTAAGRFLDKVEGHGGY